MSKRKATTQSTLDAFCKSNSPSPKKRRINSVEGSDVDRPKTLDELFGRLSDGLPGDYEAQQKELMHIATSLMTHFALDVNGTRFRLAELEVYLHHETHKDVFTHRQDDQLQNACWYFHKQGTNGGYKGGTYKGLDLTAGNRKNGVYCGFLIRSLLQEGEDKPIEGPCLCVNKILELNGGKGVAEFIDDREGEALRVDDFKGLKLQPVDKMPKFTEVYSAPRVGLTLRNGMGREKFCARAYRFSTVPSKLAKFRAGFVAAAIIEGASEASIVSTFGMKPKFAGTYCAAALKGMKSGAYSTFFDKVLNNTEICEMMGSSRSSF